MKNLILVIFLVLSTHRAPAQSDETIINSFYKEELTYSPVYENLRFLTKKIGNRISGSLKLATALEYTRQLMIRNQFDTVYLQPVEVTNWVRGENEIVRIINSPSIGTRDLNCIALGNSIGTSEEGLIGEVIEINGITELMNTDKNLINGKIVFLNQPIDNSFINTHEAYVKVSDQRNHGASQSSIKGAKAVIVRSLSTNKSDSPHTGYTVYDDGVRKIPAVAISTNDADFLSEQIKKEPKTSLYLKLNCQTQDNILTYNVIGEIKGSTFPDEIILVGGHIDSWDVGEGAQDDGGGCIQTIEILRLFKVLNIQPKHTLRVAMWVDEENFEAGSIAYAEKCQHNKEKHLAAIEADYGCFTPLGFYMDTNNEIAFNKIISWKRYFEPYQIFYFKKGTAGIDIEKIKDDSNILLGLMADSQRYGAIVHSQNDVFETVDKRELELGAAAIASMVYLIDKYGIE